MSTGSTRLAELIALAREPSSDRRRELLREVTDLFFDASPDAHGAAMGLFDEVMSALAADMEAEVRAELAVRLAPARVSPPSVTAALANDEIAVALPLLTHGRGLAEADLLAIVRTRSQAHLQAVSSRGDLSFALADEIVERGDDATLGVLLDNDRAPLSRTASETVVDRSAGKPDLQRRVVDRHDIPVDLLNEMYFQVEARLRHKILTRIEAVDPAELDAALDAGRKRVATRDGALPPDYAAAEAHVRALLKRGSVQPATLAAFLRAGERTRFLIALCEMADVDFHTARRIVEKQELDGLAIICKAADFDRALFLTFTVLILDPGQGMARAADYGRLYADLPREAALRAMRFWRMRRTSGDGVAA